MVLKTAGFQTQWKWAQYSLICKLVFSRPIAQLDQEICKIGFLKHPIMKEISLDVLVKYDKFVVQHPIAVNKRQGSTQVRHVIEQGYCCSIPYLQISCCWSYITVPMWTVWVFPNARLLTGHHMISWCKFFSCVKLWINTQKWWKILPPQPSSKLL